jgi:predicted transcriptional regulator
MKVSEWIDAHPGLPATVDAGADLEAAVERLFAEPGLRDIYVVDEWNRVLGHLSHQRIAHLLLVDHRAVHTRRQLMERVGERGSVDELMESQFPYCRPGEDLDDVLHRQLSNQTEALPVLGEGNVMLGAVVLTEVMRHFHYGQT